MKSFFQSVVFFVALSFITGVMYPLFVTLVGQLFFFDRVNGSLVTENETVRGSVLVAQNFQNEKYFWPRPSASDFGTVPSGASNFAPTSQVFSETVTKRRVQLGEGVPPDMLMASGSGLDPHISVDSALFQASRIATARNLSIDTVKAYITHQQSEKNTSFLGQKNIVNVLELNLSLDRKSYEK